MINFYFQKTFVSSCTNIVNITSIGGGSANIVRTVCFISFKDNSDGNKGENLENI